MKSITLLLAALAFICSTDPSLRAHVPDPLKILTHPDDVVSYVGGSVSFAVAVEDVGPRSYQWRFNGVDTPGETAATLTLNQLSMSQTGGYTVAVTNGTGTTISRIGHLCITPQQGGPLLFDFSPRFPIPNGMILRDAIHDGSRFVAVVDQGVVITSTNGQDWSAQDSGLATRLSGIAIGSGLMVAVGERGYIMTSPDGVNWSQRSSSTQAKLRAVAYGNGRFVAVGAKGAVLTSADGIFWIRRSSASIVSWSGVTFGNGVFVAVGAKGAMMSSSDGVSWKTRISGVTSDLSRTIFGGGKFVAIGVKGIILTVSLPRFGGHPEGWRVE